MATKKRSTKRAPKKAAPKRKNPTTRSRSRAAKKPATRRRRRRKANPDWGKVVKTGALALGGVLLGAVAWGGIKYIAKDIDIHPLLSGSAFLVGGVALAGLHPWQREMMLGAGGILGALGASEIASGVMGKPQGTSTGTVTTNKAFLPTSAVPGVRGIKAPVPQMAGLHGPAAELSARDYGSPASELADGDYHGIVVPEFLS